jgi:hypothetical protein
LILPKSTLEFTLVEDIRLKPVLERSGHTNHSQGFTFFKMKLYESQLLTRDLGCQNIFGQNKGWQR